MDTAACGVVDACTAAGVVVEGRVDTAAWVVVEGRVDTAACGVVDACVTADVLGVVDACAAAEVLGVVDACAAADVFGVVDAWGAAPVDDALLTCLPVALRRVDSPRGCKPCTTTSGIDIRFRCSRTCKSRVSIPFASGLDETRSTTSKAATVANTNNRKPRMMVGLLRKGCSSNLRRFFLLFAPDKKLDIHRYIFCCCLTLRHLFRWITSNRFNPKPTRTKYRIASYARAQAKLQGIIAFSQFLKIQVESHLLNRRPERGKSHEALKSQRFF